ncbi:ParB/RepB/Spo0J family partition protein [Janibacter indicus]|uniref:ParB/RepB/Spo0J family partition protein n=1 Tax=Janibacter indicus TaxID=857417 RepID=UPI003EBC562A
MSDKRRGLGRGLGALIPDSGVAGRSAERPVDVFFRDQERPTALPNTVAGKIAEATAQAPATPVPADHDAVTSDVSPETGAEGSVSGPSTADEVPATSATTDDPGDGLAPVPGASFAEIPLDAIRPNPRQPRTVFDEDDMSELVHSIREIGVLQPIVVRRVSDGDDGVDFELIMGERRWRASRAAERESIPAIVKATEDDDLLRDALLENLHRSNLNPLEEAAAYQQLLDDFGCTKEELAGRIGRSRPQISNTLRLLRLPPMVARRVAAGVLSAGHARALLTLDDGEQMERLAQRIVAEGLSVRSVEEIVALGLAPEKERRTAPRAGRHHPQLDDLAGRVSDRLDTRVKINLGQRKGRMTIEFASMEDLHRVLGQMGVASEDVDG